MLKDPQLAFQKAIYSALTTPAIVLDGKTIRLYEFAPKESVPPYVLFKQPTVVPLSRLQGCRTWECTVLLDIVTTFTRADQASSLPASLIAEMVLERLLDKKLALTGEFQMAALELVMSDTRHDNASKEFYDVHRYLRLRTVLEQHTLQAYVPVEEPQFVQATYGVGTYANGTY